MLKLVDRLVLGTSAVRRVGSTPTEGTMKINYAIICYKKLDETHAEIKHKCLYENEPQQVDFDSLQEELATDEELGMVGDDDYEMMLINRYDHPNNMKLFKIPDEIEE